MRTITLASYQAGPPETMVSLSPDSSCCGIWPKVYWAGSDPGTSVNVQLGA
jgi:hypothetical protein